MRENKIETRFKKEVEKRGGKALKFVSPGWSGAQDRIVLLPGARAIFVELKATGEELRPLQKKRATELKGLGFTVYCIDSFEAIDEFIAEVMPK